MTLTADQIAALKPGDIVQVRDALVGRADCGCYIRCLFVGEIAAGWALVRSERCLTKADLKRGHFDPWTKKIFRVAIEELQSP